MVWTVAWVLGGLCGLWIGGMVARQYLGVDVLTPIEQEAAKWWAMLRH